MKENVVIQSENVAYATTDLATNNRVVNQNSYTGAKIAGLAALLGATLAGTACNSTETVEETPQQAETQEQLTPRQQFAQTVDTKVTAFEKTLRELVKDEDKELEGEELVKYAQTLGQMSVDLRTLYENVSENNPAWLSTTPMAGDDNAGERLTLLRQHVNALCADMAGQTVQGAYAGTQYWNGEGEIVGDVAEKPIRLAVPFVAEGSDFSLSQLIIEESGSTMNVAGTNVELVAGEYLLKASRHGENGEGYVGIVFEGDKENVGHETADLFYQVASQNRRCGVVRDATGAVIEVDNLTGLPKAFWLTQDQDGNAVTDNGEPVGQYTIRLSNDRSVERDWSRLADMDLTDGFNVETPYITPIFPEEAKYVMTPTVFDSLKDMYPSIKQD